MSPPQQRARPARACADAAPAPRRVKEKLRTHTGTGSQFAHLTLMNEFNQVVADMSDDNLKLGYFSPQDGWSALPHRRSPPHMRRLVFAWLTRARVLQRST